MSFKEEKSIYERLPRHEVELRRKVTPLYESSGTGVEVVEGTAVIFAVKGKIEGENLESLTYKNNEEVEEIAILKEGSVAYIPRGVEYAIAPWGTVFDEPESTNVKLILYGYPGSDFGKERKILSSDFVVPDYLTKAFKVIMEEQHELQEISERFKKLSLHSKAQKER